MGNDDLIGRRKFTRQLMAGTGIVAAGSLGMAASASDIPPPPNLPEPAEPPEKSIPEPPPEVLLMTYLVRAYPSDHFDEQAIQGIFRDLRSDIARGQILAEFPLTNSDEPSFVFSPYRSADGTATDPAPR